MEQQYIPMVTHAGIVFENGIDRTPKNEKVSIMINFDDITGENKTAESTFATNS